MMATSAQVFQDGGKLKENAFYIEREADKLLYENLSNGEYCSILDPRQVGKSSLMERTSKKLTQAGVKCGYIDLQSFANADITFEKLINSLIFTICRSLEIEYDNLAFLKKYESLSANKVLEQFFREVVFPRINSKIALFIDEVDIVKSFKNPIDLNGNSIHSSVSSNSDKSSIGDSFFLTFRSLHESRTSAPFDRLAVCFAGVAFPADLVSRPEVSPFNIGQRISLSDFSREEMQGFRQGLMQIAANPDELIDEVYKWTNGHPYMTQKIFADLAKCDFTDKSVGQVVEERVNQLFFVPNISPDANLAYAVKRLTSPNESEAAKSRRPQILETFSRIKKAEGKKIPLVRNLTDTETPSYDESRLFGLTSIVREQDGTYLKVRNLIYDRFFSDEWVANAIGEQRDFRPFFERWLKNDKADDYLLRGEALYSTLIWAAGREDVTIEEREFIDKSLELNQQQILTEEQAKRARTFRIAAILSTLLLVVASYAWFDSNRQKKAAMQSEANATAQKLKAENSEEKARDSLKIAEVSENKTMDALDEAKDSRANAVKQKELAEDAKSEAQKSEVSAKQQAIVARAAKEDAVNALAKARESEKVAREQKSIAEEATKETIRLREINETISKVTIRQERSTQPKYNEEQQAVFRKDAEKIANTIDLQSNDNPLPKTFSNWKNQKLSSIDAEKSGEQTVSYAGELVKNNKTINYYAQDIDSKFQFLSFMDEKGQSVGDKINIPPFWNTQSVFDRSVFSQNGDFFAFTRYVSSRYFDYEKKRSFNVNLRDGGFISLGSIFQSGKNTKIVALISGSNILGGQNLSRQSLAVLNKETETTEKILKGFYFLNLSGDVFLFQDEDGLHTVDINDVGNITDAPLPQVAASLPANDKIRLFIKPLYDKKSGTVVIIKTDYKTKGFADVFNLSTRKIFLSNYLIDNASTLASSISPQGDKLLISTFILNDNKPRKSKIQILDISKENAEKKEIKTGEIEFEFFTDKILFSADGTKLAVAENQFDDTGERGVKGVVHVFDAKSFLSQKGAAKADDISHYKIEHEKSTLNSIVFYTSGNKNFIVSGDEAGLVKISKIENQTANTTQISDFVSPIQDIEITADNNLIIKTNRGVYSRLMLENDSFVEKKLDIKDYFISSSTFKISPTFKNFATFAGKEARIWNADGSMSKKLDPLKDDIKSLEYSPDGKYLCAATASEVIDLMLNKI